MKDPRRQARVSAFLRKSLAEGAQDVLKLEAMARRETLLGERQSITDAKAFSNPIVVTSPMDGSHSLLIRSQQFGTQMPQGGHPPHHSINSSACSRKASGIVRSIAFAVRMLTAS